MANALCPDRPRRALAAIAAVVALAWPSSLGKLAAILAGGAIGAIALKEPGAEPPAAQALPGPLFTFAAYLGTVNAGEPMGVAGGLLCLAAIFLPSFLLILGVLPFSEGLRRLTAMRRALLGVNAAVVGLLLAALYDPVWTSGVWSAADAGPALVDLLLLTVWRLPPSAVVAFSAVAGWGLTTLS